MQTRFVYFIALLLSIAFSGKGLAQDKKATKKTPVHNYDSRFIDGKSKSTLVTESGDDLYRMEMENDKIMALYVNDEKIPESHYNEYSLIIAKLKEQLKIDKKQALEDQRQAKKDQQQAKRDGEQAHRDMIQAKLDREQAMKDKNNFEADKRRSMKERVHLEIEIEHLEEAKEKADQDQYNAITQREKEIEVSREQMEIKKSAEEDMKELEKDQEQAKKDQAQAKLDQEQSVRDQIQAKKDQEQAEEDQRLLKLLINDLIKDGIITGEKDLHTLSLTTEGMTVNDVKQSNETANRYKKKYKRFSTGNFNYEVTSNGSKSIRMHRG